MRLRLLAFVALVMMMITSSSKSLLKRSQAAIIAKHALTGVDENAPVEDKEFNVDLSNDDKIPSFDDVKSPDEPAHNSSDIDDDQWSSGDDEQEELDDN